MELLFIIIVVAIAFSALILVHEFGHFLMALKAGIKVESFSFGFGPKLFSFKRKDIEYKISAIPFGGYVKMAGDDPSRERSGASWEFLSAPLASRLKICFAGPVLNYVFGFLLFVSVFCIGYPVTTKVGTVMDGYPAKAAGIMPNDTIVAVDGMPVRNWIMMTDTIKRKIKGPVTLGIKRNKAVMTVKITPKVLEGKDIFGNTARVGAIGITPSKDMAYEKFGINEAVPLAFSELIWITKFTYQTIGSMFTGKVSFKEAAGPVGIITITAAAAKAGASPFLYIVALISVSLAIFNLLPFPPLDGGLILFFAIEKLRGKPLSFKTQEVFMQVGWTVLIALMLFVTYNDIFRFVLKR